MGDIDFNWDRRKAAANARKHGVTFEEAETVFYDESALLIEDPEHSADEDRFILLGLSVQPRVLVVVHAYRADDHLIRIISARKATKPERTQYNQRRRQ